MSLRCEYVNRCGLFLHNKQTLFSFAINMETKLKFIQIVTILFFAATLSAQKSVIKKELEWDQKGYFILNPELANNNNELAFVCISSGVDSISNKKFPFQSTNKVYLDSLGISKRIYDPLVCSMNTQSGQLSVIDFGWEPAFSPNANEIVYAFQKHSLKRKDKLYANVFAGNIIKLFDKKSATTKEIARSVNGYLLDPVFEDSIHILYKTGDKINGPYGGGVSLSLLNLKTNQTNSIQRPTIRSLKYEIIGAVFHVNGKTAYTVYSPVDSGGEDASLYLHLLMSEKDTLYNFGTKGFTNLAGKLGFNAKQEMLYLDDGHFMEEDTNYIEVYKNKKIIHKKPLNFSFVKGYLSAGGKYMLYTTADSVINILNLENFETTKVDVSPKEIHAIAWSRDDSRLVIVQDHETLLGTDKLTILKLEE